MTTLSGTAKNRAATCNGEPTTTLTADSDVPCSPVRVANVITTTETSAQISWTYANDTEIEQFAMTFDFDGFTGTLFRTALDTFIGLNTSTVSSSTAREILGRCEAVFLNGGVVEEKVWAFQLLLTNAKTTDLSELCVFVGDSAITPVVLPGLEEQFDLTIDVDPGETYTLKIRAAVLVFGPGELVDFKFGPFSNEVTFVAQDAPPGGPVVGLSAQSREDDRVALQWSPPVKANGAIVKYVIVRELVSKSQGDASNVTFETGQQFFTVTGLAAGAKYNLAVFAETSKGPGPLAAIGVETCPENMLTLDGDATTCVARRGFFSDPNRNKALACSSFGQSIELEDCLVDNLRVDDLKIASGFWRPSLFSTDFRECPLGSTSCSGGQNVSLCQPNYEGPMCAVCSEGYFSNGVECDSCEDPSLTSFTPVIAAFSTLTFLLLASFLFIRRFANRFSLAGKLALKLKVLISTYQIVGTFTWTLGTAFPKFYTEVLSIFLFMSFDITDLIPGFHCIYRSDYLTELCVVTGLPLSIVALIFVYWKIARYCSSSEARKRKVHTRCIQAVILVTFLVYTPVASKIFRALRPCDAFEDIGTSYMPEDYTIVCGTTEHTAVVSVAYAMLLLYCAGIPVLYAALLWPRRRDIQRQCDLVNLGDKRTSKTDAELASLDAKLLSISFLFQSYWYWWWELVEVLRKVVLAGIITLIGPGTAEQSIVLMIVALGSTVLYHHFLPLRDENLLGLVASYTVFFAAFASLLVKVRTDFLVSPVLDTLLVVIIVSPIVFALILSEEFFRSIRRCCSLESRGSELRALSVFVRDVFGKSSVQAVHHEKGSEDKGEGMLASKSKNASVPLKAKTMTKAEKSI